MAEDARQIIKKCAIKLFAKKSFEGTSVREIASAAKVSAASTSYHFGSKSGLFEEIIADLGNNRLAHIASILETPQTHEDMRVRLELFTRQFIELGVNFPDETDMIHRNLNDPICEKLFVNTFRPLIDRMQKFFNSAKAGKLARRDLDTATLCQLLLAPLTEIIKNRNIAKAIFGFSIEDKEFQNTYVKLSVECFLNGVGNAKE